MIPVFVQNFAKAVSGLRRADASNPLELGTDIPGELIKYQVKPGDVLKAGDPLCVLESMKMEIPLQAPCDGVVRGHTEKPGGRLWRVLQQVCA